MHMLVSSESIGCLDQIMSFYEFTLAHILSRTILAAQLSWLYLRVALIFVFIMV